MKVRHGNGISLSQECIKYLKAMKSHFPVPQSPNQGFSKYMINNDTLKIPRTNMHKIMMHYTKVNLIKNDTAMRFHSPQTL